VVRRLPTTAIIDKSRRQRKREEAGTRMGSDFGSMRLVNRGTSQHEQNATEDLSDLSQWKRLEEVEGKRGEKNRRLSKMLRKPKEAASTATHRDEATGVTGIAVEGQRRVSEGKCVIAA